jgi:hypothetical protein
MLAAIKNVKAIAANIKLHTPKAAQRIAARLIAAGVALATFPEWIVLALCLLHRAILFWRIRPALLALFAQASSFQVMQLLPVEIYRQHFWAGLWLLQQTPPNRTYRLSPRITRRKLALPHSRTVLRDARRDLRDNSLPPVSAYPQIHRQ